MNKIINYFLKGENLINLYKNSIFTNNYNKK